MKSDEPLGLFPTAPKRLSSHSLPGFSNSNTSCHGYSRTVAAAETANQLEEHRFENR